MDDSTTDHLDGNGTQGMKSVGICTGSWASFQVVVILSSDWMSTIHNPEVPCGMPPCSVTWMQRLTAWEACEKGFKNFLTCELNIILSSHTCIIV